MHHALQILELVEMICGNLLQPDSEKSTRFPDLNAVARTCKFFLGPALSLMWRKQYTLINLFKCMPADLWEEAEKDVFTLVRPITPSDWERPLMYASRVKHFVLVESPPAQDILSAQVLETLGSCTPREHLFPHLETIAWAPAQLQLFPYLQLFLGPKIIGINVHFPDSISALSLLPVLSIKYPALTVATLRSVAVSHEDDELQLLEGYDSRLQSMSLFVRGLTHIRALDVDGIDQAAFEHLGHLTTLRTLNIGELQRPTTLHHLPFPALVRLHFRDASFHVASAYIGTLSACKLELLEIDVTAPATAVQTSNLYAALPTHCAPAALILLTVNNAQWYEGRLPLGADPAHYAVPSAALRPLFCFSELKMANLQSPAGFDLDDATVWALARSWPRLRLLSLKADTAAAHCPPRVTLDALRAFAQHCPSLESLALTLTAVAVPPLDPEVPLPPQTSLRILEVGASPIAAAPPVAGFLATLFPELHLVVANADSEEDETLGELWMEVVQSLRGEDQSQSDSDSDSEAESDSDSEAESEA
ncbi:hypothetical protein FB451DRAFT_1510406 [Mycena latifolia]|nr:hypothetical protein FB451DRAFT_1510406 [Mycena latifolia]